MSQGEKHLYHGTLVAHTDDCRLILLFTDDAPRSRRARAHLAAALGRLESQGVSLDEIDLIARPEAAVRYRAFATPALIWTCGGKVQRILYGDLSDREALEAFLTD